MNTKEGRCSLETAGPKNGLSILRAERGQTATEGEREGKKEREEGRGMVGGLLDQQIDLHM